MTDTARATSDAFATADLMDAHQADLQSCDVQFRDFGGRKVFAGQITTLRVHADNGLVKARLNEPGAGRVLVVDGGGSLHSALLGDMIGTSAVAHGWSGVVIYGAVRDVLALARLDLGIKALGANPRRSAKDGTGESDVALTFGGAEFRPGDYLYADLDGVVLSAVPLL